MVSAVVFRIEVVETSTGLSAKNSGQRRRNPNQRDATRDLDEVLLGVTMQRIR
jgi:hypothetical protein